MAKRPLETNPFVSNASGFTIPAVWRNEQLGSHSAPEAASTTTFRVTRVETALRMTLYTEGLLNMFLGLSSAGKDMMMYIVVHLKYDQDYLELDEDKYIDETGSSRATFFRAKTELTNRVIIPRVTRKGTYWINPMYMFRGQRMAKYPDKVKMENEHPFPGAQK